MKRALSIAASIASVLAFAPAIAAASTPASAPVSDRACTLSASLTHPSGDLARCLSVGATLSQLPEVGQTATLSITVKAARAEARTNVFLDLPKTFSLATPAAATRAVTGSGPVTRVSLATFDLAAGQTRTLTRQVTATGAGFGAITATARSKVSATRTDAGTDSIFVTTRGGARASVRGGGTGSLATTAHATAPVTETRGGRERRLTTSYKRVAVTGRRTSGARPSVVRPDAAGTSCATGTWNYLDQNGVSHPAMNTEVDVLNSANTLLNYGVTDGNGAYNVCWASGGATTNVYLKFLESNNIWRVTDLNNNVYFFTTGTVGVADGTTYNFDYLRPSDNTLQPALHSFAIANDDWLWVHQYYSNQCWSPFTTSCLQLTIHWQRDSTVGPVWNPTGVYLPAGSPDTVDEPAHEVGHDIMYETYGNNFPTTTNCQPHYLFYTSSATCAWTEGWADWVGTSVYNNTVYTYNGGGTDDFNVTWNERSGDTGDQVEARVVQAMRSLSDGAKYPFDNDPGEGAGVRDNRIWLTLMHTYRPNTFADVWSERAAQGNDVSQTALSALYQGTIDYGFRNPLADNVGKYFPLAVPDHHYSYATHTGFWSVVAERPVPGTDNDLTLYNDSGLTSSLGTSAQIQSATDFIAVNSNDGHRPLQTYYPSVHRYAGSSGYTIQEAQGLNTLTSGKATVSVGGTDTVKVWDSYQTTGTPIYYRAVPTGGFVDVQLFSAAASGNITTRPATTAAFDTGQNQPSALALTPTSTGYGALIMTNNDAGAGTVTVYADITAPVNNTISINNGAAATTSSTVNLSLSSTDTDTGVASMQISTDGTFDTEPVVPYATTATANIGTTGGTRTVYVRYLNNAGMWSAPVSDTIVRNFLPVVTSVVPNGGPTAGGNTITINGANFGGATGVKIGTVAATNLVVVSSTKITVKVPAQAAAAHGVYVTTPSGTNSGITAANSYTYEGAPTVTSVSPSAGPTTGGNTVTINGTNFTGATQVKIGTVAATNLVVVSPTKITVKAPAQAAAVHGVYVTTAAGTNSGITSANSYTYRAAPTVTSVSPNTGPTAGGNTVTVNGTNFTGATQVKIGTVVATNLVVVSSTKITIKAPAQAAAAHGVYVTTPNGANSGLTSANQYTYV